MSWQAYVDTSLIGTGHIDKAAIISAAGDSTWANSDGFTLKPEEMKEIVQILEGPGAAVDKAHAEGIHVSGDRYVVARIEGRSIYARKGKEGLCIAKTKQCVLVGHHPEAVQAGNATQAVEALADYLAKAGY